MDVTRVCMDSLGLGYITPVLLSFKSIRPSKFTSTRSHTHVPPSGTGTGTGLGLNEKLFLPTIASSLGLTTGVTPGVLPGVVSALLPPLS